MQDGEGKIDGSPVLCSTLFRPFKNLITDGESRLRCLRRSLA